MGGNNITNDLAIGLKTDLEIAEQVKVKHATLEDRSKRDKVSVQHHNINHVFDADEVKMIVEARVDEILEYVDSELAKIKKSHKLPGGAVIVGGTANISGIAALSKQKLGLAARVGKLQGLSGIVEDIQDPSYITCIGLMQLDMLLEGQMFSAHSNAGGRRSSLINNLGGLWQRIRS